MAKDKGGAKAGSGKQRAAAGGRGSATGRGK